MSPTPWPDPWTALPRRQVPGAGRGSSAAVPPARRASWSSGHLSPSPSVRRAPDAHTWISESSAPHRSEQRFEDGWSAGARDIASHLLRIADTTAATGRGRAASSAMLGAHLQQPVSPAPHQAPAPAPAAPALDGEAVRAAALRCTWALSDPGNRFLPDASDEVLAVALSAVLTEERDGYARLQVFAEQHRECFQELLRGYGPDSTPAGHGRRPPRSRPIPAPAAPRNRRRPKPAQREVRAVPVHAEGPTRLRSRDGRLSAEQLQRLAALGLEWAKTTQTETEAAETAETEAA